MDRPGCGRRGIWVTAATVMIVALGGGQRMELFGRVLCHQPWKSGRRRKPLICQCRIPGFHNLGFNSLDKWLIPIDC